MRYAAMCAVLLGTVGVSSLPAKVPFTIDAMMRLARIDDPQVSPDGKIVAFTVQTVNLANNTKPTNIYIVPVAGGSPQRITSDGTTNARPRWTPDSKRIFFTSDRPNTFEVVNSTQVWSMNADGSDPRPITNVPTGADGVTISPDGSLILFTSDVYPACSAPNTTPGIEFDSACNKTNLDKEAASKTKVRVYNSLLYRHWNQYQGARRRHLLIQTLNGSFKVRDLTPGPANAPPFSLGGPDGYAFSPDSVQIAYVANTDSDLSTSTNSDLFTVSASGGPAKRITTNPGADEAPLYSPDGRYLAYRTQRRGGYESDQWSLAVIDLQSGNSSTLTDSLDRWVETFTWASDSQRLFFTIDDHGTDPLMMISVDGGAVRTIAQGPTSISSMQFTPHDRIMIYAEQSGSHPVEIYKATSKGGSGVP